MRIAWIILFFVVANLAAAQNEALTTFILVRHAEKETNVAASDKDPKLSGEGLKRANRLVELFSKATIDAVYSTPFIRTKKTVEPLANAKSLAIQEYQPNKLEEIDKMLVEHRGKTIVLCGHSNTIPKIANHLSKTGNFQDLDDADYGNVLIVTVSSIGNSNSITWLRY